MAERSTGLRHVTGGGRHAFAHAQLTSSESRNQSGKHNLKWDSLPGRQGCQISIFLLKFRYPHLFELGCLLGRLDQRKTQWVGRRFNEIIQERYHQTGPGIDRNQWCPRRFLPHRAVKACHAYAAEVACRTSDIMGARVGDDRTTVGGWRPERSRTSAYQPTHRNVAIASPGARLPRFVCV
jgi:hypothetical protein